ncbi:hypothetical protein DFO53_3577 [Enterobacter sp. AG5470]|nr:hypothetical protein DFO53_3577 [Enterobacter sp. AG5470]
MNNSPLLSHYQVWLDDFTRVSLLHGLCQQHITQLHRLPKTSFQVITSGTILCKIRPNPISWSALLWLA